MAEMGGLGLLGLVRFSPRTLAGVQSPRLERGFEPFGFYPSSLPSRLLGLVAIAVVFATPIFLSYRPKGFGGTPRQQDVSEANSDYRGFADAKKLSTGCSCVVKDC